MGSRQQRESVSASPDSEECAEHRVTLSRRGSRRSRTAAISLGAIAIFLAAVALGLTYGARGARGEGEASPLEAFVPTAQQSKQALESPTERLEEAPETDPQAARDLPHRDLERAEALELAEGVFGAELESPAGIFDELEPQKFLSNYAAVMPASALPEPPGEEIGEPQESPPPHTGVLLESTIPLRTENAEGEEEAVDLSLQRSEGELQPGNPLTEVGIPTQLGEGVSLPGAEVEIVVAGAPENVAPSNVEQQYAFFPNVSENTDLIVAPSPAGVEMMTDIRSAEAPLTTNYRLSLPAGASLKSSSSGGAEVVQDGRTTVVIPPPTATDAAGNSVSAEMQVSEDELAITASPEAGAQYPILVDPTYIVEGWNWTWNHDSLAAWSPSTTFLGYCPLPYSAWDPAHYPGLDLSTFCNSRFWAPSLSHADWSYSVPRYASDLADPRFHTPPSTWVYQLYTQGVLFLEHGTYPDNYPALVIGITNENYGWNVSGVHYGGQGEMTNWSNSFTFTNEYLQTGDKGADMNLVTYEEMFDYRDTFIALATVAVVDEDAPTILELNPPGKWVGGSWASVPYAFEDKGLGMELIRIGLPGEAPLRWPEGFGCNGTTAAPCPREVRSSEAGRPALAFVPNELPTGKDKLEVTASDVLGAVGTAGHTAQGFVVVKVDHTAPEISLSGSLTEQGTLGTRRPAYALRINAKDGTEAAPQSGVTKVEVKVDGKKITMPEESEWAPNCQTQNCSFAGEWGLNVAEFSAGTHEVQVIATDAVGDTATKTLTVELHPPAPTLSLSGTITEQSTLGISRPQYKLKINASALAESPLPASPPGFSLAFGASGTGSGQFSHPGDVALDSSGNLWVVDTSNNRVEEFNSSGTYLASVGASGTGNGKFSRPTSIAIDANNDIWVTDSSNKRVEEFNHSGEYLRKFGTAGTGNGQFAGSGPEGIAIDYHGNIWVSDTYGGRLEKFNENGEYIRSVGTHGTGAGQLLEPNSLDIGPGGNVWVSDWGNNKVVEFGAGGACIRQFGSEGSGNGEFRHPDGIAIDSKGDVWVGDRNNERFQEFNQGGEYIGKFGVAGSGSGQFNLGYTIGIATDNAGNVWVTDTGNNRVQKWTSANYGTAGMPTYLSSFGSAGTTAGHFSNVLGLAVDGKGNVWAADAGNNLLQKFNSKGEFVAAYGSAGSGNGQLSAPASLTANAAHIWVGEVVNQRIQEFSESGSYLAKFGQAGSGAGQLEWPWGIAFDGSHHIWVAETGGTDVQEFSESGTLLKTLGKKGSSNGQFNGATGIAVGPGGKLWVVDIGNNRVEEFTESGSFIRQFGGSEAEVGHLISPMGIYVDSNEHVWVVDRGHNRVVEFNGAGEYVTQFGSAGSGPGQFSTPEYVTGDSSGHLFVSDNGNSRVEEWSKPALHSQISTEITIDGKRADAAEAGCEAETCTTQHEWTLGSSTLAPGIHTVVVKATDGFGNTTTKTLNIEIARDTTKPALEVGGELASAPEGWVEQESYGIHASATDSGSGVTSLNFTIDGTPLASKTQNCPEGACPATISTNVDMGKYEGGAHEAEVVATDGAGNTSVKHWTINVDPEGHISTIEAEATLEAIDETSAVNSIGPSTEESEYEGTEPGLAVTPLDESEEAVEGQIAEGFEATGTSVPVTIGARPEEGAEYHVLPQEAFQAPCADTTEAEQPQSEEPEEPSEESEESGESEDPALPCVPMGDLDKAAEVQEEEEENGRRYASLEAINVSPEITSSGASEMTSTGSGTVAANTTQSVDTVFRPLSDGGMSFEIIRDQSAPTHYAFEMDLSPELELRQLDDQDIGVYYKEGFPAFSISAEPAHDAIGTTVPTHLAVTGSNVITLTVDHRSASPVGGSFVYPVIGGAGWEGGYRTISVELTEPEPENEEELEEGEAATEGLGVTGRSISAPVPISNNSVPLELLDPVSVPTRERNYRIEQCTWEYASGDRPTTLPPRFRLLAGKEWRCTGIYSWQEGNLTTNYKPRWAMMMRGQFSYKRNSTVWIENGPACFQWGKDQPSQIRCYPEETRSNEHLNLFGQYRFDPGHYFENGAPICYELNPVVSPHPPKQENGAQFLSESFHWSVGPREWHSECNWHHLHQVH
jgi:tripartite motif-containing protein 71